MRRVVFVLFAALMLCSCQGINKTQEREPALTYVDWSVSTSKLKDGSLGYWAITETRSADTGKALYGFLVPVPVANCALATAAIAVTVPGPLQNVDWQKVEVTVRVDELPPMTVNGAYEERADLPAIYVEMPDFFKNKPLRDQLIKGQTVRFMVRVKNKDYTVPFTLRNHVSAMKQAINSCEESAQFFQGGKAAPGQGPRQAPAASTRQQRPDDSDDSRYFKK